MESFRKAVALAALALAPTTMAQAAPHALHYLSAAEIAPATTLPAPPPRGSEIERAELAELRAIIASATPERMTRAEWDDSHEDPAAFDAVLGLKLEQLPRTWALLKVVQEEADAAAAVPKNFFARVRPWGVDPKLPHCDAGTAAKPTRSYPSGHSSLGYSVGYVLAQMLPERAPVVLGRAADYAMSREICGAHFPSDTEASHVLATLVASRLLQMPAFRAQYVAARSELRAALRLPS